MASKTIATILSLKDQFSTTIKNTTKNTKQFERQIQHTQNSIKEMKNNVTSGFKGMALKVGGAIAGIGILELAKQSVMLASDLAEVQNVVDTTFGGSVKTINDWSKNAISKFGLSELQAKKFNGTMGAMLKSSGLSEKAFTDMSAGLTGLAGDFASFYNLDAETAFDKIRSGVSGEAEPLKQLGINMSVANLQAYALSQGMRKQYKDMTQAEQTTLRYNYLLNASKDAQGDFIKTNKGFANQLRITMVNIQQRVASIASKALPYLNKFLIRINEGIGALPTIFTNVKAKIMEFWNTFKVGDKLNILKTNAMDVFNNIKSFIDENKQKFIDFKDAIVNLATTLYNDLKPSINSIAKNGIKEAFDIIKTAISGVLDIATKTFNFINDNWSTIKPLIEGIAIAWGAYKLVMLGVKGITTIITAAQWLLNAAMNANPVGLIITSVGLLIGLGILLYKNWDKVKAKAFELWEGIKIAFAPIGEFFAGVWKGVKDGFRGLINFIIGGINLWIKYQLAPLNLLIKAANLIPGVDIPKIAFEIPQIPEFANGTNYFKGGLANVNERGGEIVNLPGGSQVIPADKSEQLVNNFKNKSIPITIHIHGNVYGENDLIDKVGNAIQQRLDLALNNM